MTAFSQEETAGMTRKRIFRQPLRVKLYCEGKLDSEEEVFLDTSAEEFLKHIETDLSPTKSYKMVALLSILELPGTKWKVKEIAHRFLEYYLLHTDKIGDYEDLARYPQPEHFPLAKVIAKLNAMPLHFLSNKESDFFLLNKKAGQFQVKPEGSLLGSPCFQIYGQGKTGICTYQVL